MCRPSTHLRLVQLTTTKIYLCHHWEKSGTFTGCCLQKDVLVYFKVLGSFNLLSYSRSIFLCKKPKDLVSFYIFLSTIFCKFSTFCLFINSSHSNKHIRNSVHSLPSSTIQNATTWKCTRREMKGGKLAFYAHTHRHLLCVSPFLAHFFVYANLLLSPSCRCVCESRSRNFVVVFVVCVCVVE